MSDLTVKDLPERMGDRDRVEFNVRHSAAGAVVHALWWHRGHGPPEQIQADPTQAAALLDELTRKK